MFFTSIFTGDVQRIRKIILNFIHHTTFFAAPVLIRIQSIPKIAAQKSQDWEKMEAIQDQVQQKISTNI